MEFISRVWIKFNMLWYFILRGKMEELIKNLEQIRIDRIDKKFIDDLVKQYNLKLYQEKEVYHKFKLIKNHINSENNFDYEMCSQQARVRIVNYVVANYNSKYSKIYGT